MGLTYSSVVYADPDEVFAWHSRAGAITRLMPPWQPVRVAQEAPSVRDGEAVLALPGGLRWVAGHAPDGYDPPRQFADVLQPPLGAALHWRHTHVFAPAPGGTLVTDVVSTPIPAETPVTRIRLPCKLTPARTSSVVDVAPKIFAILFLLDPTVPGACLPTNIDCCPGPGIKRRLSP